MKNAQKSQKTTLETTLYNICHTYFFTIFVLSFQTDHITNFTLRSQTVSTLLNHRYNCWYFSKSVYDLFLFCSYRFILLGSWLKWAKNLPLTSMLVALVEWLLCIARSCLISLLLLTLQASLLLVPSQVVIVRAATSVLGVGARSAAAALNAVSSRPL